MKCKARIYMKKKKMCKYPYYKAEKLLDNHTAKLY